MHRAAHRLWAASLVVGAAFCNPSTLILEPAGDTYVSRFDRDKNFGGAATLEIYGNLRKALLRFDLSAVPAPAAIISAKLSVTFQRVTADFPIHPKRYFIYDARDFAEGEATWTQAAQGQPWGGEGMAKYQDYYVLPYQAATLLAEDPGEYAVDLTPLARATRAAGRATFAITLFGGERNAAGSIYSRESTGAHPKLTVEYSATAPMADAGGNVIGFTRLDGSQSALPDGTKAGLSYVWTVDQAAPGSSLAGQKAGESAVVTFVPDVPGYYVVRLRVTNPATGEYDEDSAGLMTGVRPHPRLQLDADLVRQIRGLRDAGDRTWTRFYNWISAKPKSANSELGLVMSYLLAYVVNGDRQYFDGAWEVTRVKLYQNGTDRAGGLRRLTDLYQDAHAAAFQGGPFIAQMATVYDWGYDQLTPAQRQDLIDWLNDAVSYNYLYNDSAASYFRNDGAAFTYGLAAAVYATLGENPEAPKEFAWFRHNWDEVLQALDIMGKGGASGEGNAYGASPTAFSHLRTANLVWYASGEDLFLSHAWFRQRLLFDAFGAYPGTIGGAGSPVPYGWPGNPIVEQASIGGDGRRGASWHSAALRPNGLILSRHFAGTEEADIWNWVYRQPAVDRVNDLSDAYSDVLYYSPPPALVKPTRLSFFDPSMGFVYMRSDWDSADATWIAFWAGPHLDTHQHLDQGAFAIFKRRDLAPKTGHYDVDNVSAPHDLAYYTRTVSSNGILIGDPYEVFNGFIAGMGCDAKGNAPEGNRIPPPDNTDAVCIPNDGGERTMHPFGLAAQNAEFFRTYQDVFDVARVVSFEDRGDSVSVVADITNAYNNPRHTTPGSTAKVNRVYRRLVYLREPDLLVVGDTVEAANAGLEKKWLVHALDRIEVGGDAQPVSEGEYVHRNVDQARIVVDDSDPSDKYQTTFDMRSGFAALWLKTVWPGAFQYRRVGGREPADTEHADVYRPDPWNLNKGHFHRHIQDFRVRDFSEGAIPNHKSFNWMPESPIETAATAYVPIFGPGYGRWRLEIEPTGGNQTDYFLNILKPTLDPGEAAPLAQAVETADSFGAEILAGGKKWEVMFPKDALEAPVLQ